MLTTPNTKAVAEQFEVKALEPRLEMLMPYGRSNEQAYPDGCDRDHPMPTTSNEGC